MEELNRFCFFLKINFGILLHMNTNNSEAEQLFIEANGFYGKGDHNEAIQILRRLEQDFPDYKNTYLLLARIYRYILIDRTIAEDYYKKALDLDAGYKEALYEYANLLHNEHRFDDLERLVNSKMKTNPTVDRNLVYEYMGIINEYYKKYSKAIGYYKKCITYTTNSQEYENYLLMIDRCNQKKSPLRASLNREKGLYTLILLIFFFTLIVFQNFYFK